MPNHAILLATLLPAFCATVSAQLTDKPTDWLLAPANFPARFTETETNRYTLSNGIVTRAFMLTSKGNRPSATTVSLSINDRSIGKREVLRTVKPEAIITIEGQRYEVGGLIGQPNHAFLRKEWLNDMRPSDLALKYVGYTMGETVARFPWKRVRHHAPNAAWPPPGKRLTLEFESSGVMANSDRPTPDFRVYVHYELYDGVPVICKWLTIKNESDSPITVDHFACEVLGVVEHDSRVETRTGVSIPNPNYLHVETDFAFGGFLQENANRHVVHWRTDPKYATQVNYERQTPCLLVVEPTYGPAQTVQPNEIFTSVRAFELFYDSTERERRSLTLRKMYRVISPWVTENPLMHHMRVADPDAVRRAIDEAADIGFEMVILSFGSGFDIENDSAEYLDTWREIARYAAGKGVEIGGYSLLSSRRIGNGHDIVSPVGVKPTHGSCPALTSEWGRAYYKKLYAFFEATGFTLLEHDGPYPGDVDITPRPPHQKGEEDSRWVQGQIANKFYRWCREQGIYVNAPDFYFHNGTNKCGMGYREVNWSLPRAMQLIHTRQNIFDGTWHKAPSMGWMFVPLSEYHGGGAAATIEPLKDHLTHYERMLQANLSAGVQACFRGPRLYDAPETRTMLKRNVAWFKKYRDILESDIVHGRRPDGRNLDWIVHVNPQLDIKGMLIVHNPTNQSITETIRPNLYFTGLADSATLRARDQSPEVQQLSRDYSIEYRVTVEANSMNWVVIR